MIDANKGCKASWCLASIIEGLKFLKKDLLWDVCTGESIRIWNDKRIPQRELSIPMSHAPMSHAQSELVKMVESSVI